MMMGHGKGWKAQSPNLTNTVKKKENKKKRKRNSRSCRTGVGLGLRAAKGQGVKHSNRNTRRCYSLIEDSGDEALNRKTRGCFPNRRSSYSVLRDEGFFLPPSLQISRSRCLCSVTPARSPVIGGQALNRAFECSFNVAGWRVWWVATTQMFWVQILADGDLLSQGQGFTQLWGSS
ncbi:hypothetical protein R6Q59_006103 [Mikania micrantha]